MTEEEKEFAKKVNMDKAKNKSRIAIILIIISLATYVIPFMLGEFDFGIIFEAISLLFIIIARSNMNNYDIRKAKRNAIISIVSIGWIFIFDILMYFTELLYVAYSEIVTIGAIAILFSIIKDLDRADNPEKYKNNPNWFYENYDGENKGD